MTDAAPSTPPSPADRLSAAIIGAWATPSYWDHGHAFGVYYMKFATDVLLVAPAIVGTILAAARFWDAISDPLIGYLLIEPDRDMAAASGMFFAAVPMGLALVGIWSPPERLTNFN